MKLGLIGYPVNHSLSPGLYQEILGDRLTSYDLISCPATEDIPTIDFLSKHYDGINITSPYKEHFVSHARIDDPVVKSLGAINTLAFRGESVFGTNTDLLAVRAILMRYCQKYPTVEVVLLGSGVMARITKLVCEELGVLVEAFSRRSSPDLATMDLATLKLNGQVLVINACSRDFIFSGRIPSDFIFWDYNYSFNPHLQSLPKRVKSYVDGQEMLRLQAEAAVRFWEQK